MRSIITSCIVTLIIGNASPAAESNAINGESLHNKECLHCHGYDLYHRNNRRIHDKTALTRRVHHYQRITELTWSDEEIDAVSDYLAKHHYLF